MASKVTLTYLNTAEDRVVHYALDGAPQTGDRPTRSLRRWVSSISERPVPARGRLSPELRALYTEQPTE